MFAASVSVERVGEATRQRGPALLLGWHAHTWHVAGMPARRSRWNISILFP